MFNHSNNCVAIRYSRMALQPIDPTRFIVPASKAKPIKLREEVDETMVALVIKADRVPEIRHNVLKYARAARTGHGAVEVEYAQKAHGIQ